MTLANGNGGSYISKLAAWLMAKMSSAAAIVISGNEMTVASAYESQLRRIISERNAEMWRLSAKTVSAENGGVICEKR
jgi:hypothetical protein